ASFMTSLLAAGAHSITASYGGDHNFAGSTSPLLRQVINATNRSATVTALTSNLNPSTYGQPLTFMAMVTSSGPNKLTGSVAFRSSQNGSNVTLGTIPLNTSGVATLIKSNLTAFYPYPITAVYLGDAFNLSRSSPVLTQVVKQASS